MQKGPVWLFSGFEIHPGRKAMLQKVLQVFQTRGSRLILVCVIMKTHYIE